MVTTETPVVDPERVSVNHNFDQTYLEEIAVGSTNRGYQDVLFAAPGVGSQTGGGSNPSVFGSTYRENAYYLDGSNTTDPVTLTFGSNLTFDAIQEMSFHTGGFEQVWSSLFSCRLQLVALGDNIHGDGPAPKIIPTFIWMNAIGRKKRRRFA